MARELPLNLKITLFYYFLALAVAFAFFQLEMGNYAVLCLHDITPDPSPNPFSLTRSQFLDLMKNLRDANFSFLSPAQIYDHFFPSRNLPLGLFGSFTRLKNPYWDHPYQKKALLVFDDNTKAHADWLFPWLRQNRLPAAFAFNSETLDQPGFMTTEELRAIKATKAVEPYFHGRSHRELPPLGAEGEREITPPAEVQPLLDSSSALVFPYGHYDSATTERTARHWNLAFTLDAGFVTPLTHPLTIPRLLIHQGNWRDTLRELEFYSPIRDWDVVMKILVLLLTFFLGHFAFTARDLRQNPDLTPNPAVADE